MAQVFNVGAADSDVLEIRLLVGRSGQAWSEELRMTVAAFSRSHRRSAHVDFSEVDLGDVKDAMQVGVRALAGLRDLAAVRGGALRITGANGGVERALQELYGGQDRQTRRLRSG